MNLDRYIQEAINSRRNNDFAHKRYMHRNPSVTEAVSGRLSTGRKKYQQLSGFELNHTNLEEFLEACGYKFVGDIKCSELIKDYLNEKVYATDGERKYRDDTFKIVAGEEIYLVTIPRVGLINTKPDIKKHSHIFDPVTVEELENAILGK